MGSLSQIQRQWRAREQVLMTYIKVIIWRLLRQGCRVRGCCVWRWPLLACCCWDVVQVAGMLTEATLPASIVAVMLQAELPPVHRLRGPERWHTAQPHVSIALIERFETRNQHFPHCRTCMQYHKLTTSEGINSRFEMINRFAQSLQYSPHSVLQWHGCSR